MKKRKKPLGRVAQATRNAIAQEVFRDLLKNPHLIVEPKKHKGSRMANKRKAINESY